MADINALILAIYRAAEEPASWPLALNAICQALEGTGAAMVYQQLPAVTGRNVTAFAGFPSEAIGAYERYFYQLDPWARAMAPGDWVAGRVLDGREVVAERDVTGGEWFADFAREYRCAKAVLSVLEPLGQRVGVLTINRARSDADFSANNRRLLKTLTPHLRQAFRLHRRLGDQAVSERAALDALERLPHGVILVDESGRPVFANAVARGLLEQRNGLSLDRDRLRGASAAATRAIGDALNVVLGLTQGAIESPEAATLQLPRPSGASALHVVAVPVSGGPWIGLGHEVAARAAIFVTDPDADPLDDITLVRRLFGLTPTEARVAAHLVNGSTVPDIAGALSLSLNTVRWHLKRVLQKADTRTQAQFVSRVLRSPVWVRRHERR